MNPRYRGASVLLVNHNFGCGSSREHAPQALFRAGIRALVGETFSEIFFGNALIIGLPCVTAAPENVQTLMERVEEHPDATLRIDLEEGDMRARQRPLRDRPAASRAGRACHRRMGYHEPASRAL